jgi:DHA1 family bicyclomycin/chloramphenicol resistance-like MFS transporter
VAIGPPGVNKPQAQGELRQAKQSIRLLIILSVLLAFASISTDLFLPALPAMSIALAASQGTLQLAISGYLLGFGFGQLFWGPISDRFGRRGPVALGIAVFVVGSAGCALSTDAWQIIGWRVVQALGASAGVALARAMVRDLYDRDEAARLLSSLMTVMAVAPLLGPSAGAQILAFASWQAIFWTLVAIGVGTLVAVLTLPETLPQQRRETGAIWQALAGYRDLLRNRILLGYTAAVGFFYAGVFANIAGGPFAYISYHHLAPALYGLVFASGVFGLMLANVVNSRLVMRVGSDRMLLVGVLGAAIFGTLVAFVTATGLGGVFGLISAQLLFTSMNGFILANAVAGALSSVKSRTGAASAFVGAIQYGSGMIGSALVGAFANNTPVPMGCVMALAGAGSLLSVLLARGHDVQSHLDK